MQCHSCSHPLIEKARFCDDCGVSTARVDLDEQALLSYCSKCAATLRGSRKYCIHCGEPSPHSGKFSKKTEQSWLLSVLMDSRVQMAIGGLLLLVAALPAVSPVRYRFKATIPFVEAYLAESEPRLTRQRDHENFRIRPIIDPETGKVKAPGGVARDSRGTSTFPTSKRAWFKRSTRQGGRRCLPVLAKRDMRETARRRFVRRSTSRAGWPWTTWMAC